MFSIPKSLHQMQKGIWSELCLRLQANFGILGRKTYHPQQTWMIEALNRELGDQVKKGRSKFPLFYKHFKCLRSQEPQGSSESKTSQESQESKRPQGSQIISYIDVEKFDMCEIVAYSLVCEFKDQLLALEEKEIQREKNQPASIKKNQNSFHSVEVERRNKIYDENLNALINLFFDKLKESVESLLKSKQVKQLFSLDPYQENVLKWQLTINIRRRFIQIMRFYEEEGSFSTKILKPYEKIARKLVRYFRNQTFKTDQKSEEFNNIIFPKVAQALALIEEMSPKNQTNDNNLIHPLVGDEFRALFSTNINEQLWSPYTGAQKRFQESNSSTAFKIQKDITRVIEDYSSLSFIPTSITQMIFQRIMNAPGKYHMISGLNTFGKSMSFVLYTTLNNYIPQEHIVLIPTTEVTTMEINFFEAFWDCMNKKQMKQWVDLLKQFEKGSESISSRIIKYFCFFKNLQMKPSRTVIIDQFEIYVEMIHQKQQVNKNQKKQSHELESIIKYLNRSRNQKLIYGSSIQYHPIQLSDALQIYTIQQISVLDINRFFTNQQASYIIKLWLQKIHQIKLNSRLLFIKQTYRNKQLQQQNEAQDTKELQEKRKKIIEERLHFTQKLIDFYFSWENQHCKQNSEKYLVGGMSLLKKFSENLYTSFFLSEKEVEFLKTTNYIYEKSDLSKNIRDKLLEFMREIFSQWYLKQIKNWILEEENSEIRGSRRIIVSEIILFNEFSMKRFNIHGTKKKELQRGQRVSMPYFLISKNTYAVYKHMLPLIPQIYNQLKLRFDTISLTMYLVKASKTFAGFMSATTLDLSKKIIGSLLHNIFNLQIEFSKQQLSPSGSLKRYPLVLNFIQAIKFSKQELKDLRRKCPIRFFKMDSTYKTLLQLNESKQLIEGKKTKNQFVKQIQRYICRAVQECEEKSMDLSQHPLYVYVMTAQGQPSCDGILVEVQKFQDYYSLRILMIELGINRSQKLIESIAFNNLVDFHFFKEGFQKNNKTFKISSRNLAVITSSKGFDQIVVGDKVPKLQSRLIGRKVKSAYPTPPQLPAWRQIIWDDIKIDEEESLLLHAKLSSSKKAQDPKEQLKNGALLKKMEKLNASITFIDFRLIDSFKEIKEAYWIC